jgi:hypothetical protein
MGLFKRKGINMKRYLHVSTLTDPRGPDCSCNGVTVTHRDKLVVPCDEGNITEGDVKSFGYVVLELKSIRDSVHFKPVTLEGKHSMFGGNFVYSSDSRFARQYGRQPIHVHDRVE